MTDHRPKREKVRVVARFRPPTKKEHKEWSKRDDQKYSDEVEMACSCSGPTVKIENSKTGRPLRFTFDEVLWTDTSQEDVFQTVAAPTCRNALNGFNGTVFIYGQTGAGKTHSMIGPEHNYKVQESGIVPRAASFFFQVIENSADIDTAELRISFLEVYKDQLRDLNPNAKSYPELKIRQKINGQTYIENLNEAPVTSLKQVLKLIESSNAVRTMASSSMNRTSARSHLIVTFNLRLRKAPEAGGHRLTAKINFVDLGGSERIKKPGAVSQQAETGRSINKGISALCRVTESLVKRRKSIPFSEDVLTSVMKDSLAGNTRTTLLLACSPHSVNKEETISSCRFGLRCGLVKTNVLPNKELTAQQSKAIIVKLRADNRRLDEALMDQGEVDTDIQRLQSKIEQLQFDLETQKRENAALQNELYEQKDEEDKLSVYRTRIEDLGFEVDDLKASLEESNLEKRNLAVMAALFAMRLDGTKDEDNQHLIKNLSRCNIEYLNQEANSYMVDLHELQFANDEAQDTFDRVVEQIQEFNLQLNEREDELKSLRSKKVKANEQIETLNFQVSKLQNQVEINNDGADGRANGGGDDDEQKYDQRMSPRNKKKVVDIDEQQEYLQSLAEQEQELWDEREENAWRKYLKQRAQAEGFKKAKELLKHRRREAETQLENGEIDEMPQDEDLLEDIRDAFYRLFDPATGTVREDDDDDAKLDELMDVPDENAIDDPFEWSEDEVVDWLQLVGLRKKYGKIFRKEVIDGRVLLVDLTKTNLKRDLMVKSVHVDKIIRGIAELRLRSPGYQDWQIGQGLQDERVVLNRVQIDDEFDVDFDEDADEQNAEDWQLTDEEKQFGEQFWQLDELFSIMDVYKIGELDLAAFKHGLHALDVDLTDSEMDDVFRQIDTGNTGTITYRAFVNYLSFTDLLAEQSRKYASDILAAMPKVASNRRQYVTRAAMVIKYAVQYNNTKTEINNYLLNKGLTRAEIASSWKQYRFNPKAIRDIDFQSMIGKKGKLVDMTIQDPENVKPFNDFGLLKLLKRAGFKSTGSKEFNDLIYLRASGDGCRIQSIRCLFEPESRYFNGFQVTYECANGQLMRGGRNYCRTGQPMEDILQLANGEVILSITVYFAQYVSGVLFVTNHQSKLCGSDESRTSIVLSAPAGTCILAFYGSIGRLVETLGIYVVATDHGRGKRPKSGQKLAKKKSFLKKTKSKKKLNRNNSNMNVSTDGNEGEYQSMTATSSKMPKDFRKVKSQSVSMQRQGSKFEDSSTHQDEYF